MGLLGMANLLGPWMAQAQYPKTVMLSCQMDVGTFSTHVEGIPNKC